MTEYRKDIEKVVQDMGYSNPLCSHSQGYCEQCGILASPAELAEYMRNRCVEAGKGFNWEFNLVEQYFHSDGLSFASSARIALREATPEQRIKVAVAAWEASTTPTKKYK